MRIRVECDDYRIVRLWSDICLLLTGRRPVLVLERGIFPHWIIANIELALIIRANFARRH